MKRFGVRGLQWGQEIATRALPFLIRDVTFPPAGRDARGSQPGGGGGAVLRMSTEDKKPSVRVAKNNEIFNQSGEEGGKKNCLRSERFK